MYYNAHHGRDCATGAGGRYGFVLRMKKPRLFSCPLNPFGFPRIYFGGNSYSCIKQGALDCYGYQDGLTRSTSVGVLHSEPAR
jgi:hypothetical protein